ncbi:MAG: beta-propeller domain-containing protein [Alphaproteobacteria bacterium]|nr:beta-propeller domain-containing protein [Alphaproteobacteria bacterium]MBV9373256.1 beta-propeller domain-containing protein [Alphaproteobacteria bacterium]MBV9901222.1 beta-propeller domain-containing protein [Alphaproteobacteria bacterium]
MMRLPPALALALGLLVAGAAPPPPPATGTLLQPDAGPGLSRFRSDRELRDFLRRLRARAESSEAEAYPPLMMAPPPPSPPPAAAAPAADAAVIVTGSRIAQPNLTSVSPVTSITNTQEAAVDEGGIVKLFGDNLVILRRGRLFTVSLAGGRIRPIDSIDAFPPGVSGAGDWYDEMLISGDRVIVVGYSYARGGTEINRFRIARDGRLRFEDAYHLRSNDYYSSRNYASRLIGNRLIFYTPLSLDWDKDPFDALPGLRRWGPDESRRSFRRLATAQDIYIPKVLRDSARADINTLHSVTTCDVAAPVLSCSARGVLGPASRTFYVSADAVYLWTSEAWERRWHRGARGFLYRLPLGWERPKAIGVRGAPVDQFSFREDRDDGLLNVLVRAEGGGDWMWSPEMSAGGVALLRLPLSQLGAGAREAPRSAYRVLPRPEGESWNFHNRFAGDYVLYGAGPFGDRPERSRLVAAPLRGGRATEIDLRHAIDRIELLGRDAMVVGGGEGGLGFSAIELRDGGPRLGDLYVHPDSAEGETRSHAFFFSPDPDAPDGASGTLGLPVTKPLTPAAARFLGSSAAMLFLRRDRGRLAPAGEIEAHPMDARDDGCQASCVDWYGNARPIFVGDRVFALLGYELVEGRRTGRAIREVDRVSFAPRGR